MAKSRKPRSDAKMYQLPKEIQDGVNERLINYNMSYGDITSWLEEQGYKISAASLSRYAFKVFESARRIADDLEKTKYIIDTIGRNPDIDTTEATTAILKSGLLQKISSAEDEFNDMPVEKAGKLFIQLARTEADRKRTDYSTRKRLDLAFEALESNLLDSIKSYPELAVKLRAVLAEARDKVQDDLSD